MNFRGLAAVAALSAALVAPSAASAVEPVGEACAYSADRTWQAFLAFGDTADYWLAPGGDFEGDLAGWSLHRARVTGGNENTGVLGGKRSLRLGVGRPWGESEVVTPPFCITKAHSTFRYLLKANSTVGHLSTSVRYRAADGTTQEANVRSRTITTLLPGRWKPSDPQPLAANVPLDRLGGVAEVQLVFRVPMSAVGAGYQIDNVLIDPYRTR